MAATERAPKNFTEYVARFPKDVQAVLRQMRKVIKDAAPEADEIISYRMPAFKQRRILVWFGAHSEHIGFYPGASGIAAFKNEFGAYKFAKGSVQFPLDEPLPVALIARMVKFRIREIAVK